jgi:hypothetical protein
VAKTLFQPKKYIKQIEVNVTKFMDSSLNYILCCHCLTPKHCTEGAVPAKNCQGFQVLPPSMDFSRAQTPGRGESAIVTTTYATYAHQKIYISKYTALFTEHALEPVSRIRRYVFVPVQIQTRIRILLISSKAFEIAKFLFYFLFYYM